MRDRSTALQPLIDRNQKYQSDFLPLADLASILLESEISDLTGNVIDLHIYMRESLPVPTANIISLTSVKYEV